MHVYELFIGQLGSGGFFFSSLGYWVLGLPSFALCFFFVWVTLSACYGPWFYSLLGVLEVPFWEFLWVDQRWMG